MVEERPHGLGLAPLGRYHQRGVSVRRRPSVGVDLLVLQQHCHHPRVVLPRRHVQRRLAGLGRLVDVDWTEITKEYVALGCVNSLPRLERAGTRNHETYGPSFFGHPSLRLLLRSFQRL